MADVSMRDIAEALLGYSAQQKLGYRPYDGAIHSPSDMGLGGLSTEYLASEYHPFGEVMNYPQIWYDGRGEASLLSPDQAYEQAIAYEAITGKQFPRFDNMGGAEMSAMSRSAMGGGDVGPLAKYPWVKE